MRGELKKILVKFQDFLQSKYVWNSKCIAEAHSTLVESYKTEYEEIFNAAKMDPYLLEILPYHLSALNDIKLLEDTLCTLKYVQSCAENPIQLMNLQLHLNGYYLTSKSHKSRFLKSSKGNN